MLRHRSVEVENGYMELLHDFFRDAVAVKNHFIELRKFFRFVFDCDRRGIAPGEACAGVLAQEENKLFQAFAVELIRVGRSVEAVVDADQVDRIIRESKLKLAVESRVADDF